ncbi:MAG: hypothetical protein IJ412_05480 [Oscillospiraceae bacterium]|nr:hypothetical protein [Oscillospiraceae bacterium]
MSEPSAAAARFACTDHSGYRAHKQPHKAAAAGAHAPAGLAVIQGRTTGGDWLKEQRGGCR